MEIVTGDTTTSTETGRARSLANLRPWQPGQSGNPKGRSQAQADVEKLCRDHSKRATERIVQLIESEDERVALMASKEILDRAFGKVKQAEEEEGDKRSLTINIVRYSDGNKPASQLEPPSVSVRTLEIP